MLALQLHSVRDESVCSGLAVQSTAKMLRYRTYFDRPMNSLAQRKVPSERAKLEDGYQGIDLSINDVHEPWE